MAERMRARRALQHVTGNRYPVAAWKRWGGTREGYEDAYREQQGRCGICACELRSRYDPADVRPNLPTGHFDHCHKRNKPRGVLCRPCNIALGYYETRIARFHEELKAYRRKYRDNQ